jgi:hypothetical protein
MTKRPQAAMLRFIWEALRKSWPGGEGGLSPSTLKTPALPFHAVPHLCV